MDQRSAGGEPSTAGVLARPILMFPVALLIGLSLDHVVLLPFPFPRESTAHWITAALAGAMLFAGILTFVAGARAFAQASTPLPTNRPTSSLVTTGIYRWSRNPIYVALLFIYVSVGLLVRSSWIMLWIIPLWLIVRYGVVSVEELYLQTRFGEDYVSYKRQVRRWL